MMSADILSAFKSAGLRAAPMHRSRGFPDCRSVLPAWTPAIVNARHGGRSSAKHDFGFVLYK
jgi:hypothetical protein